MIYIFHNIRFIVTITTYDYYVRSRGALMTGYYPFHIGMQHGIVNRYQPKFMPKELETLPEALKKQGYATHMVGKYGLVQFFTLFSCTDVLSRFIYHQEYFTSTINLVSENTIMYQPCFLWCITIIVYCRYLLYKTIFIRCRWHLGFCNWNYTPTYRGFDSFYGFYSGAEDYYTHKHCMFIHSLTKKNT